MLDIFQTGSGTSTNMNANEVIANRALQLRGGPLGSKSIHPNDHVNLGQSSNDVIPTAMQVAACVAIRERAAARVRAAAELAAAKAREFDDIVKSGRTHMMDATPVRLGQEFGGYAAQVEICHGADRGMRSTTWPSCPWVARPWARASTRTRILPADAIARLSKLTGIRVP